MKLLFRTIEKIEEKVPALKNDNWTSLVALSTAMMAVFAAFTTLYMGKYSSRAVLIQGQESDQWAYYQAKSIKSHTYELQKKELELYLLTQRGKLSSDVVRQYQQTITDYNTNISRYDLEKTEIKDRAEDLAKEKTISQTRGGNYGYSLIFLQIAIMLSSIAAITKKRPLWYLGLASMGGWLFYFLNAVYMFY